MAFLPPEQQNNQAPQGQTTANPQQMAGTPPPQSGGSTGAGAGASKAGSAPSTGSPTQFGSSASKLGDYLSANAPQITNQANTVASGLNNAYGQISGDITNAANQFGQSVQQGYAAPNQDLVNQAASNPTDFASNAQNVKDFQGQYNNAYTGPQNYESTTPYGNIQSEVSNAVQNAGAFNTQAGLQNYFQGQGGNQTQASNTLDSLLIQGNPEAQQTITTAANQYQNLTPQFQQSTTAADQSVQAAQKAAQDAQSYARNTFNPVVDQFGNTINTGAANAEAQRNTYNQSLNNFYSQAVPVEQQINQWAGALPNNGGNIQDLIAPIVAANNKGEVVNPITAQNYSTPEQYAEAQALQQLTGNTAQLPIDQSTVGQAGTAGQVGAPVQSITDVLGQYQPILQNYFKNAFTNPANASVGDTTKNSIRQQTAQLQQYLASIDPSHYSWQADPNLPGGNGTFSGGAFPQ